MAKKKFVDVLVPEGSVEDFLYVRQVRRKVRYWLFRLRSEAEGLGDAKGIPAGLKTHYKKQEWFDGWENFGATWDVDDEDPLTTVPRWETIHEEWDRVLEQEHRANRISARQRRRNNQVEKSVTIQLEDADGSEGDV